MKTGSVLLAIVLALFNFSFAHERVDSPGERADWFYMQRAYPKMEIESELLLKALKAARNDQSLAATIPADDFTWEAVGPTPIDGILTGCGSLGGQDVPGVALSGRVSAIAADPTNPSIVYCGGANGGVWKSTDGGVHWSPITDDEATQAVGSIAIDPNNPSTIYVGTGEASWKHSYYGLGILKSTDGGASWGLLGKEEFAGRSIAKIVVDPANSNRVWAAVSFSSKNFKEFPITGVVDSVSGGFFLWMADFLGCGNR